MQADCQEPGSAPVRVIAEYMVHRLFLSVGADDLSRGVVVAMTTVAAAGGGGVMLVAE